MCSWPRSRQLTIANKFDRSVSVTQPKRDLLQATCSECKLPHPPSARLSVQAVMHVRMGVLFALMRVAVRVDQIRAFEQVLIAHQFGRGTFGGETSAIEDVAV